MRWMHVRAAGPVLLCLAVLACTGGAETSTADPAAGTERWEPLFDGKTLAGWRGDATVFSVRDGMIVGRSPEAQLKENRFLGTERDFSNFVLRLKFQLVDGKGNSGVQFRSEWNNGVVKGYQADLGDGWYGKLYDEHMRNRVLAGPPDDLIRRILKRGEWNTYEISAVGPRIELKINGETTATFVDTETREKGIFALQVHSGAQFEVRFKEIEIRKP